MNSVDFKDYTEMNPLLVPRYYMKKWSRNGEEGNICAHMEVYLAMQIVNQHKAVKAHTQAVVFSLLFVAMP